MKDSQEPRTEIEWSLRAIIFVVGVLAAHMPERAESGRVDPPRMTQDQQR